LDITTKDSVTFTEHSIPERFCELAFQKFPPLFFCMQKGNKKQRVHRLRDFKLADRFLQPVTKTARKRQRTLTHWLLLITPSSAERKEALHNIVPVAASQKRGEEL